MAVEGQATAGVGGFSISRLQTFPLDEKYYLSVIPGGLCETYVATFSGRGMSLLRVTPASDRQKMDKVEQAGAGGGQFGATQGRKGK